MPGIGYKTGSNGKSGISYKQGYLVLGNDLGDVNQPAVLQSTREIPMGGFNLVLSGTGNLLLGTATDNGSKFKMLGGFYLDNGAGAVLYANASQAVVTINASNAALSIGGESIVNQINNTGTFDIMKGGVLLLRVSNNGNMVLGGGLDNGSRFQVSGSVSLPYREIAAASAFTAADYTINVTAGTFAQPLPTAVGIAGRVYVLKNRGAGAVTLTPAGAELIDGAANLVVAAGGKAIVQSTNVGWITIG